MDDQPLRFHMPPAPEPAPERPSPPAADPDFAEDPSRRYPLDDTAPRSRRRSLVGLLLILLLFAAPVAWFALRAPPEAPQTGRYRSTGPMPVGTAKVEKGDVPIAFAALGTVTPLATVTVKTQIAGQLTEVAFREGQMVKKGDFLAQIDPRPYQVALAQAEAQLAKDQAALRNAELDLQRYRTLVAQNSLARQTLDTQASTVQQARGVIQADQAQVDAQKLNLAYCRIVAPIGGRVGLRQVDPGNYVQPNDANGIVVITQLQPISVIFTLPEDKLAPVMKRLAAGAKLPATAYDRSGQNRLATGRLDTVDNQIDPTTGTIKLRASFDNADQILFPNQFVNVELLVDTLRDADLVPVSAVQRGAPGSFVYVVTPDSTAAAQPVTLGPAEGQRVAVLKGLEPGQTIVTDGADRIKDGAKIVVSGRGGSRGSGRGQGEAVPAMTAPTSDTPAASDAAAHSRGEARHRGQGDGPRRRRSQE